ncbi:uroplakin-3b-like protein 1 isoform X1 [Tympanuchus pallidicinctus]|uniref:uroplakin-3b-like protein 1 isoform X1 n=1 Tax=Tympanuchus pallidicinctus TaxID=109042 RepID=UPI0022870648|nr:uroplakin-3b-like protein 1 isoform X1 [Tympanuchus pallidicinctus]
MRPLLLLLLLLLATAHGLVNLSYQPLLARADLGGRVTGSTFVLEQPRCVFDEYNTSEIWLVVATSAGKSNFSDSAEPEMPEWSFQRFPANTSAYLTLGTMQYHYRCLEPNGELTVLRVGSETSCAHDASVPNCNGPLPSPGPYWVKFLVRNGSEPIATTQWSEPITLKTGTRQIPSSPGMGGGRSGAMIAIAAILSVLLAVLLAAFLTMLCSSEACGVGSFRPDSASIQRYNTHHVYDQPAARL